MSELAPMLTARQKLAATLEAAGRKPVEIVEEVGISKSALARLKDNQLYQAKVAEIQREIEDRLITNASDWGYRVDKEAERAFETLQHLHEHAENESVRRRAAVDIWDHAPNAPRAAGVGDAGGVVIQIAVGALEGMKEALGETGRGSVVELIEGADYMVVGGEEKVGEIKAREV